jgi:hypothetical protein
VVGLRSPLQRVVDVALLMLNDIAVQASRVHRWPDFFSVAGKHDVKCSFYGHSLLFETQDQVQVVADALAANHATLRDLSLLNIYCGCASRCSTATA